MYRIKKSTSNGKKSRQCPNCGLEHSSRTRESCTVHKSKCRNCQKLNHWARVCCTNHSSSRDRSKNRGNSSSNQCRTRGRQGRGRSSDAGHRENSTVDLNEQFELITFKPIEVDAFDPPSGDNTKDEVFVKVNIDLHTKSNRPSSLEEKLDTRAQSNLLSLRLYHHIFPQNLTVDGLPKCGAWYQAYTKWNLQDHMLILRLKSGHYLLRY